MYFENNMIRKNSQCSGLSSENLSLNNFKDYKPKSKPSKKIIFQQIN